MRIAIVEDREEDREHLSHCLSRFCTEQLLNYEEFLFTSGTAFLQAEVQHFDLIFLDVYMPGLTGLDTAKKIREYDRNVLLIFTTTSKDFAVQSFRVRAFDYLLKPFTYEQLAETMQLVQKNLSENTRYLTLKTGRTQTKVLCRDIVYVDYNNHYIQIHTDQGELIRSQMYFDEILQLLKPYPQFLYCNRNCLLNMDKVARLEKNDFIMNNNVALTMNRPKRQELRQYYADYIFEKQNGGELL